MHQAFPRFTLAAATPLSIRRDAPPSPIRGASYANDQPHLCMIRPQTVIPIDLKPVLRSGEPHRASPYPSESARRPDTMPKRKLIGLLERTILGAAMGAALLALERRLNRKQNRSA
jgi:hypothetical protein